MAKPVNQAVPGYANEFPWLWNRLCNLFNWPIKKDERKSEDTWLLTASQPQWLCQGENNDGNIQEGQHHCII